jgi:predicted dehydrogenase
MTRVIGIGVIGMGWMGLVHSRSYRTIADRFHESGIRARLVICADEVEARAREAHERLGFEEYTTDWKQVVAHTEVQVVNAASPNHLHLEMVRLATRERKHVFCEKPVGRAAGPAAMG